MATLIIEDGTAYDGTQSPIVRPNSYVTEQEYIDAFTSLNDTEAAEADSEVICASLIYAWNYLQQEFRMRWKGSRVKAFQFGDWPRRGVPIPDFFDPYFRNINVPFEFRHTVFIGEDTIPVEVKDAQILLARHSQTSTTTQESLEDALGRVTKREKLGDLEVEYMNTDGGGQRQETLYWDALKRIQPFLRPTNIGTTLRS